MFDVKLGSGAFVQIGVDGGVRALGYSVEHARTTVRKRRKIAGRTTIPFPDGNERPTTFGRTKAPSGTDD